MSNQQPTFITGTARALVSKHTAFDPAKPQNTKAHSFVFIGAESSVGYWMKEGYIEVGTAELTVQLFPREETTRNAVASLRKQQQTVRAEAEETAQRIEGQIQRLLAITNEA